MPRKNRVKPLPWEVDVYEAIGEWLDIMTEVFDDVEGKINDEKALETVFLKVDSLEEAIWSEREEREVGASTIPTPGGQPIPGGG
jgi:hypothetical protein